tara:strand:- start:2 stop:235 length:234 start_codon:yes stop_codon:yes gene_type:complete
MKNLLGKITALGLILGSAALGTAQIERLDLPTMLQKADDAIYGTSPTPRSSASTTPSMDLSSTTRTSPSRAARSPRA